MENGEKPKTMHGAGVPYQALLLHRTHPRELFSGCTRERLDEFVKLYLSKGEFHVFTVMVVSRFRHCCSHVLSLYFDQGFCNHVFAWSARGWKGLITFVILIT